jgi:hypothetical protein
MTKREFLDTVFALAPNEANAIMDAFDEYVDSNEPHWIPVTERLPEVKQRVIVQYADGSMAIKRCIDAGHLQWFYSNAVAWMPAPEPMRMEKQ